MMRKRDDAAKAASMHVRWAAMRRRMKTYPVPRRTLAVALSEALNGTIELAGPEPIRQDDLVRRFLNATGDPRTVITDPQALYYGNAVNDQSLTPGDKPRLGSTGFEDWLSHNAEPVAAAAGGGRPR